MNSQEFADQIADMLQDNDDNRNLPEDQQVKCVKSFATAGILGSGIIV
jgi:hypothetical protein